MSDDPEKLKVFRPPGKKTAAELLAAVGGKKKKAATTSDKPKSTPSSMPPTPPVTSSELKTEPKPKTPDKTSPSADKKSKPESKGRSQAKPTETTTWFLVSSPLGLHPRCVSCSNEQEFREAVKSEFRRAPDVDARMWGFHGGKQLLFPVFNEFDNILSMITNDKQLVTDFVFAEDSDDPSLQDGIVVRRNEELGGAMTADELMSGDEEPGNVDDSFFFG